MMIVITSHRHDDPKPDAVSDIDPYLNRNVLKIFRNNATNIGWRIDCYCKTSLHADSCSVYGDLWMYYFKTLS